ncbi:diketogulonate reductase-like aldo/keto reductase [Sediminihabitans luteus]|uniref:Diketogulonate reductase-like aldo/keto reductase n=1 Tax=Sediminihabitans luteus TaxID=1138585 RepID=A0A2M9CDE5_9CELL|nr:aldo/keto reductase [Sediminihabitans luteus]PJJ69951.1 diketogulonate reductase-like aldo/keto reductase [Sediminihabitans luteus]GII99271.1 oxidoreductase [Sediminihabitans luteus]
MTATIPTAPLPGGDVPLLGLGTWQSEGDDAYRSVLTALEIGYRHVDTATGYRNEGQVGRALASSGVARTDVFVTSKLPPDRAGRERETLEASLELLGVEQLDLWLIHWPPDGVASPWVWERLVELRDEGLVRSIGVSNYSVEQVDVLSEQVGETPAVDQIPWSPADHDSAVAHQLAQRGVLLEGYSPLRRTDLDHPVLATIAAAHQVTPAQVVLRWHLDHGYVVIPKSVTPARIAENFAVTAFALTADELAQVDGLAG